MRIATLLVVVLSLLVSHPLLARRQGLMNQGDARVSAAEPSLRFERMTVADGLPDNTIDSIIQDELGFLWFGTNKGLVRYDGVEFVTYKSDPDDPNTLSDSQVVSLMQDSRGRIWVGTVLGVSVLDRTTDTFTTYEYDPDDPTSLSSDFVFDVFEDSRGDIWLGTYDFERGPDGGGLNRFDEASGTFERFLHDPDDPTSLSHNWVLKIEETPDGSLWVATDGGGLNRLNRDDKTFTAFRHDPQDERSLCDDKVIELYVDRGGVLWVGTGDVFAQMACGMLHRFDPGSESFDRFDLGADDGSDSILSIYEDRTGTLWVGTVRRGLNRIDRGSGTYTSFAPDPANPDQSVGPTIRSVFEDRSGVLWVGEWGGGLSRMDRRASQFGHLTHQAYEANSLPSGDVMTLLEDYEGLLWIGTENGLAALNRVSNTFTRYEPDANNAYTVAHPLVRHLFEDSRQNLWIGTWGGLHRLDRSSGRFVRYLPDAEDPYSLSHPAVRYITEDANGILWLGTWGGGLNRFDPATGRFTAFLHDANDPQSLGNDQVSFILEDSRQRLWVGTNAWRLNLMDRSTGTFRNDFKPFLRRGVTSIVDARDGNLWVGTGKGLLHFDPLADTARVYDENAGLIHEGISSMVLDERGMLWISTERGISRFDPERKTFRNYVEEDGLGQSTFTALAAAKSRSGDLYFGGVNGVTRFNPTLIGDNAYPPPVLLTAFRLFNRTVEPGPDSPLRRSITETTEIELDHDQNDVSFSFAALHYSRPERNLYSHRLEPHDADWTPPSAERTATYTNLPPGEYTFRVRAANPDGIWNEEGASLTLVIHPPWWRTYWAYAFYVLLLGAGVYGVDRFQRSRLLRKERERTEMAEAQFRAQAAESQARALKAENEQKRNVELLSEIGRDITSTLSIEQIIDTVYESVNDLMDASVFGIGIHDPETNAIQFPATREKGKRLAPFLNRLDDADRLAVRCFTRREDIVIGDYETEYAKFIHRAQAPVAGDDTASIIYLPLVYRDRPIGVITAQSFEKHAYSTHHLNILRSLATYAAIALDNAAAYRKLGETLDDLKATQEQLVTQEKLASLGALTAGIAHEIKNPLNFINNFAELNRELAAEVRELVSDPHPELVDVLNDLDANAEQIVRHGRRADQIVHSMMEHAREGGSRKEPTLVDDLVNEYVDLAYHGRRAQDPGFNVTIERNLGGAGELAIVGQDVGRVLLNLLGNAFDAVEEASHSASTDYRPTVRVSTVRADASVEIRVQDNGPGIPDAIRERIFEPFFTTKSGGRGTGLGLSLSYEIVTKGHGGTMRVENRPTGGSTFVITLPVG